MKMDNKKPILLAGSHRSGTTWVGKIISSSRSVGYLMEPFNKSHPRPGLVDSEFDNWFQYVNHENGPLYYEQIKRMLKFQYDLGAGVSAIRSGKDFLKLVRDYYRCMQFRHSNARPLIKEPTAIFMAPWLAENFDSDVIILIRHPAAFISSLKILQWRHPFAQFLQQPALMRDYLSPFEKEITQYAIVEQSLIDQAILLWKIVHHTIRLHQQKYKEWVYLRHEDISLDPMKGFEKLFLRLGIDIDEGVRKCIVKYSSNINPVDSTTPDLLPQREKAVKRNSQANIYNWKKRLTENEINYIREHVEDISKDFYVDSEW